MPYRLSTSTIPVGGFNHNRVLEDKSIGGGFAPSCHDGYGVLYTFVEKNLSKFRNWTE